MQAPPTFKKSRSASSSASRSSSGGLAKRSKPAGGGRRDTRDSCLPAYGALLVASSPSPEQARSKPSGGLYSEHCRTGSRSSRRTHSFCAAAHKSPPLYSPDLPSHCPRPTPPTNLLIQQREELGRDARPAARHLVVHLQRLYGAGTANIILVTITKCLHKQNVPPRSPSPLPGLGIAKRPALQKDRPARQQQREPGER